jgi:hypothetical protein
MNRISSEAITSDRFKSEMIDLRLMTAAVERARVSFARMRYHLRFLFAARQPPWLGDVDWAFPTWREPRRPFDYKRECSADFTRQFPPIAGGGRGVVMRQQ